MPDYRNRWVALLYLIWYQPAQINLAFTLAQKVPEYKNPLLARAPSLSVLDFGCGSLAMQFGLALAMIDRYQKFRSYPKITLYRHDDSNEMKEIGLKTWGQFMDELHKTNARIYELLEVSFRLEHLDNDALLNMDRIDAHDLPWNLEFRNEDSICAQKHTRWLTVLHVAYTKNYPIIKRCLDDCIFYYHPDIVLTTSHAKASKSRFSPKSLYEFYPYYIADALGEHQQFGYDLCYRNAHLQNELNLKGQLHEINKLRMGLYNRMRHASVGDDDATIELLSNPVWWGGKTSLSADLYAKNEARS